MIDENIWPLFGLRIRAGDLSMRVPRDDDVALLIERAKEGIHDAEQMPFLVPWTDVPSPEFERNFVQFYWRSRAEWSTARWSLQLLVSVDEVVAGVQEITATDFNVMRSIDTGSWLGRRFQGQGVGTRMREAALAFAFDHLGAELAQSAAFEDNLSSRRVSEKLGYHENGWRRQLRRGVVVKQIRYAMDRSAWAARPRTRVNVEGFEACRALFG